MDEIIEKLKLNDELTKAPRPDKSKGRFTT